jgi:hypothetical protein
MRIADPTDEIEAVSDNQTRRVWAHPHPHQAPFAHFPNVNKMIEKLSSRRAGRL